MTYITPENVQPIFKDCINFLDQKGLKALHNDGSPFEIFLKGTTILHGDGMPYTGSIESEISIPKPLRRVLPFSSIELETMGIQWGRVFIQHGIKPYYVLDTECLPVIIGTLANILKEYGYENFLDRQDISRDRSVLYTNPEYIKLKSDASSDLNLR